MELEQYEIEHLSKVREGLSECMVLLKKDGNFPLNKPCSLAAYGNGIRHGVKGGTGSGEVNAHVVVGIEQGLKEAGFDIINDNWLDFYNEQVKKAKNEFRKQVKKEAKESGMHVLMYALGSTMNEFEYEHPLNYSAEAAIYVLSRVSGEGKDRKAIKGDFYLTDSEIRDILDLNENYEKFMLILNTGGPVDLSPVKDVKNILILSQLGSQMGNALTDVLLGKSTPSGKLTTTWSAFEDYCPEIDISNYDDTYYKEGIYVGYRYFDTLNKKALFPFGFGLSYSEFEIGEPKVSVDKNIVSIKCAVKNVGKYPGKEVVETYLASPERKLNKPWQDLVGFAKTKKLDPEETDNIEICFDIADFASYDEETCSYILEKGQYILRFGTSSVDTKPVAILNLKEDVCVRKVRSIINKISFDEKKYPRADRGEELNNVLHYDLDLSSLKTEEFEYDKEIKIPEEVSGLGDEELAYLCVGSFSKGLLSVVGNASKSVAGAAGETTGKLIDKGIKPLVMADGPAGLRLSRDYFVDKKGVHAIGGGMIPENVLDALNPILKKLVLFFVGNKKPGRGIEIKHQHCTALPIGTAIAQSWNLEYAKELGKIVGEEMERFGIDLWLAPALNIHRSVLCGRNFEYFSEDPLISGKMAAAITEGVQSIKNKGVTIKHFAANNQELNRYFNNSIMSERALREIYLKGFSICIKEADPLALMTSYNLLNNVHASENRKLIEDFLRTENRFNGIVMTDWIIKMNNFGNKHEVTRSDRVVSAGNDIFMPGRKKDFKNIISALREGRLSRKQLEADASRVYMMCKRLKP